MLVCTTPASLTGRALIVVSDCERFGARCRSLPSPSPSLAPLLVTLLPLLPPVSVRGRLTLSGVPSPSPAYLASMTKKEPSSCDATGCRSDMRCFDELPVDGGSAGTSACEMAWLGRTALS